MSLFEEIPVSYENLITQIAKNPAVFTEIFKPHYDSVSKLLIAPDIFGFPNVYSQIDKSTRNEVIKNIKTLFSCGGGLLQIEIYRPFAEKKGWTRNTEYGQGVIPVKNLTPEQLAEWFNWFDSVEYTKMSRMLTAKALSIISFPSVSVKYTPKNLGLAMELENLQRHVVNTILPNISDDEARATLGLRYTAKEIRSSVSPDWFY